jgi:hypothetical protein
MPISAFASLLLSVQPVAAPDQTALASCLTGFVALQQQAQSEVVDFSNALSAACYEEERAYRADYVARAAARGVSFGPADSEAYRNVLNLRIAARTAYLASQTPCARGRRR